VNNRVVNASGSKYSVKRPPKTANSISMVMNIYLRRCKKIGGRRCLESIFEKIKWSEKSIIAPNGQKKPQNTRPKTIVIPTTANAIKRLPNWTECEAINVKIVVKGLSLFKKSLSNVRANGSL
jgi:hypothetical protein